WTSWRRSAARCPPATIRGAGTRWSGSRPPRHPNTTSPGSPPSVPSARCSTTTTVSTRPWSPGRDREGQAVRTESRFLLGAGAFAVLVGVVYWFISYEDAGFVMLTLMGL